MRNIPIVTKNLLIINIIAFLATLMMEAGRFFALNLRKIPLRERSNSHVKKLDLDHRC